MRTYVSLDFKRLSEAVLAQFAANVLVRSKGNPKFSTLQPLLETELQPAYDRFVVSLQEAADRSRTKIAEKRTNHRNLMDILEMVAAHLNVVPGLSDSMVLEAGFLPRQRNQRVLPEPEQVQGLRAKAGDRAGEAILDFNGVPQARLYGVEWSSDGGEHWNNGTYPSARHAVLQGLPSRQELWFRVFAIGTQQRKGAPSAPARLFVS